MAGRLGRKLLAAVAIARLCACSPSNDWFVQRLLDDQVAGTVHDCVPLGWDPVRVDDKFFYIGYSAEIDETYWYIRPPWVAGFEEHATLGPQGRTARAVLGHLVEAGMVSERSVGGNTQYHLTASGFDRFFDDDNFGNNRLRNPYVCYSTIAPRSIIWKQPVHLEDDPFGRGAVEVFRVAFTWTVSTDPSWTPDTFLRAHTVVLGPASSPAIAKFVRRDNEWDLENLYPSLPDRLVDQTAWPTPQTP